MCLYKNREGNSLRPPAALLLRLAGCSTLLMRLALLTCATPHASARLRRPTTPCALDTHASVPALAPAQPRALDVTPSPAHESAPARPPAQLRALDAG
ncbi:hypothetical protein PR202_ga02541 [Eleusine coracana subsp. coracana]|uniref:Uncharacterized protein n=1 Tax=Eleusine coracana subsp. coracana TaxID=191504 RepID=A0AAV5BKD3_ELECO|nr:hypothetical protein PR202_ga02541 [Eleusine coracana subsp. coracana]